MKRNTMDKNMSRAEARRAEMSRRKIRSKVGTTPHSSVGYPCPVSASCPVRLSVMFDEQVIPSTWMNCLRDLREHLKEIKDGVNIPSNIKTALDKIGVIGLVIQMTSREMPCCLEANLNQARCVKLFDIMKDVGRVMLCADQAMASAQADLSALIDVVLEQLPTAEEVSGIVNDFPVPFCLCSSCSETFCGAPTVIQCRHCYTLMGISRRSYVPA